jgi:hypothetical protein
MVYNPKAGIGQVANPGVTSFEHMVLSPDHRLESWPFMAECVVLDDIVFEVDLNQLLRRLHIEAVSQYIQEVESLVADAKAAARPKAVYKIAFIESRGNEHVVIDGVSFTSRVLRVNLDKAHRVFAYVATCGAELDEWARSIDDILHRYWTEIIREMALRSATRALDQHLVERYRPGHTATMSPGRLTDWPLSEQRPLFALLDDPSQTIGVELTDSYLMVPTKSVSGVRFPTEDNFESCQLCPRRHCPGRKAPYDEGLYDRKYRPSA